MKEKEKENEMTKAKQIARDARHGRYRLDLLPVGGWGETQQALSDIEQALPLPEFGERSYTLQEYVDALYYIDDAGRYRSRAYEADLAQRARKALASRPAPLDVTSPDGGVEVRCAVDSQGMLVLCATRGEYLARDERAIIAALPPEWIAAAKSVRVAVVAAADRGAL